MFLNGAILGIHARPKRLVAAFRQLRRAGRIGEFVSVWAQVGEVVTAAHAHVNRALDNTHCCCLLQADAVYIAADGGRVCRPLIICHNGVPSVTPAHMAKVNCFSSSCCQPTHCMMLTLGPL